MRVVSGVDVEGRPLEGGEERRGEEKSTGRTGKEKKKADFDLTASWEEC